MSEKSGRLEEREIGDLAATAVPESRSQARPLHEPSASTLRPPLPFSPVLLEATVEQLKAQLSEALSRYRLWLYALLGGVCWWWRQQCL
jgi:hypothetical protein